MNVLFLPCSHDGLPKSSGSVRIRCNWIAQNWDGAEVYDRSQRFQNYCGFVFQKLYLTSEPRKWLYELADRRDSGENIRLAFDLCDPDFLEPEHERRMLDVLPSFDFAVATTAPIAEYLRQYLPTWIIPDRVDIAEVQALGKYVRTATQNPRLVWAGYSRNTSALVDLMPLIEEKGLDLDVLAFERPVTWAEFWQQVLQYDVLLNPRPDVPPFSYKSDNKTKIAWALGMPVARTCEELARLCAVEKRDRQIEEAQTVGLDVEKSVANWKKLFGAWGLEQ